jgi:hypothetical protein
MTELDDLRYPIGKHDVRAPVSAGDLKAAIRDIRELPDHLAAAVVGLNDKQLDTTYRQGGWTVRQVVHHLPDSHVNAYVRFKLALTEDVPVIKNLRRRAMGGASGRQSVSDRAVTFVVARTSRSLGELAGRIGPSRAPARVDAPGSGEVLDCSADRSLWLARPPSRGPHHLIEEPLGLVAIRPGAIGRRNWF